MARHLKDSVGTRQFDELCNLTDLQLAVADAWREYITSGGQMDGVYGHLRDARKALDALDRPASGVTGEAGP